MGDPWVSHETYSKIMDYPLITHGKHMDGPWGTTMESWVTHGRAMRPLHAASAHGPPTSYYQ